MMIVGHGGNIIDIAAQIGCAPEDIIDFSSNVNPLGPIPDLVTHLHENIDRITVLPDAAAQPAIHAFATRHQLDPDRVLAGNGTTQFIYLVPAALKSSRVLILGPTYADYADACRMHRVPFEYLQTDANAVYSPDLEAIHRAASAADTVFICNPKNPTGTLLKGADILDLCRNHPRSRFVVDESYLAFVDNGERESLLTSELENCLVLHSMSKIHRLAGLRLGYLVASKATVDAFRPYLQPWSVNGLAQAAAVFLAQDQVEVDRFIDQTREFIRMEKLDLLERLESCSKLTLYPSATLFVLAGLSGTLRASDLKASLLDSKILIRDCANFKGLTPHHFRISLKKNDENRQLAGLLQKMLA